VDGDQPAGRTRATSALGIQPLCDARVARAHCAEVEDAPDDGGLVLADDQIAVLPDFDVRVRRSSRPRLACAV